VDMSNSTNHSHNVCLLTVTKYTLVFINEHLQNYILPVYAHKVIAIH
jgi:hypothetical protein